MKNFEAYHGDALVRAYLSESAIKCCGTFLDNRLVEHCNIFHTTKFSSEYSFVHLMQHLDDISFPYQSYPISGEYLEATGMAWWVAYLLRYLEVIESHANNAELPPEVRVKFIMTWKMISFRHSGLLRHLSENGFVLEKTVKLDWREPLRRIGTDEGAWG